MVSMELVHFLLISFSKTSNLLTLVVKPVPPLATDAWTVYCILIFNVIIIDFLLICILNFIIFSVVISLQTDGFASV